jgi:hypothetical protein
MDLVERERLYAVLQASERFEVRGRQQVCAGGEELTQLDERRSELLELSGRSFRRRIGVSRGLGVRKARRQRVVRSQRPAAVFEQQRRHGGISTQFWR